LNFKHNNQQLYYEPEKLLNILFDSFYGFNAAACMNKTTFFTAIFLQVIMPAAFCQQKMTVQNVATIHNLSWDNLPQHPRLFANDSRIAVIKKQDDKISAALFTCLKNCSTKLFSYKSHYQNNTSILYFDRNG